MHLGSCCTPQSPPKAAPLILSSVGGAKPKSRILGVQRPPQPFPCSPHPKNRPQKPGPEQRSPPWPHRCSRVERGGLLGEVSLLGGGFGATLARQILGQGLVELVPEVRHPLPLQLQLQELVVRDLERGKKIKG